MVTLGLALCRGLLAIHLQLDREAAENTSFKMVAEARLHLQDDLAWIHCPNRAYIKILICFERVGEAAVHCAREHVSARCPLGLTDPVSN